VRFARSAAGVVLIAAAYSAVSVLHAGPRGPDLALSAAGGVVLGASIVAFATLIQGSAASRFAVWFALVFLNLAAVAVEGTLFAPAASPPSTLPANLLLLLATSAAVAGVAAGMPSAQPDGAAPIRHGLSGWALRVLAAAAIYVVLYLVIGGVNYALVTRPYYEAHAGSLTVPAAQTILLYEPIRGILIALSVVPLTLALRVRTRFAALVAGTMLFLAGGLVPLLPETSLPAYLRVASLWEIFGQNFLTGAACAYLFAAMPRGGRRWAPSHPA
jgi:hypothetical protein